ncbi:putative tRNA-splicing endonuclease subunit tsp-1 [Cercospora zeina]
MGAPASSRTPLPPPSALQTLLAKHPPPPSASSDSHFLAVQIAHNLHYQHLWTHIRIHTHSPTTGADLPRPILSGLPPQRLYVHPDEQIELLQKQKDEGKSGMPELSREREWVLPSHLREHWSLRRFGEIFDTIEAVPRTMKGNHDKSGTLFGELNGDDAALADELDGGDAVAGDEGNVNKWRANMPKRLLLATVDNDNGYDGYDAKRSSKPIKDEQADHFEICRVTEGDVSVMPHLRDQPALSRNCVNTKYSSTQLGLFSSAMFNTTLASTTKRSNVRPHNSLAQHAYYLNTFLNYHKHDSGSTVFYAGTGSDKRRAWDVRPVTVHDIRSSGEDFTLDKNGFQLVEHASIQGTDGDELHFEQAVYAETAELLQQVTGATRVVPISHVRRCDTHEYAMDKTKERGDKDVVNARGPAMFVHIDQSYDGAVQLLRDNIDKAESFMKSRWAIINVWRPQGQHVTREPLAVCDSRSVAEEDLRPMTAILPTSKSLLNAVSRGAGFEVWEVAANAQHQWYYASEIAPNEVLMIKCFDSKKDGRARRCPHTAFQSEFDSGPGRRSVEIRCLVFWEDQSTE